MDFVYTPQDEVWAARKNGVKVVFDEKPDEAQTAFAERLADCYREAFPRICEYLFAQEEFKASFIPDSAALKLDHICFFHGSTELWYRYYLPYKDRRVGYAMDVYFNGCFEEFTGIFIDC